MLQIGDNRGAISVNGSSPSIAIVGMACIFPDACSPGELWENVLAQRSAFRRMPSERVSLEDFYSGDRHAPDTTYATEAAVIEGYEFDRVAFNVVGSTFRAADLAHWLALDVASKALADAGFPGGNGLPGEVTGVLLGNTLTGEFSRANTLRLRWPYVHRVVEAALAKENWPVEQRAKFLIELEAEYKLPFPPVGEETLAGGLSNTIAGRICNQFNLKGGGYTVDGACASSLLATANACSALVAGDLDVAIAGGVDLSLDPFELVGFAKAGALASEEMRIYDKRSTGFWPGEGCGMVVLMRHDDALAQGRRVYAVIRGWGVSSDGAGGITRPESEGQMQAVRRAYRRAGFGIETVSYCEGHGTGTALGDATELEVLSRARRESKSVSSPAVIGSIKANIGHTKAASGVAGLIKATMAVHTQVLPPTTGCEDPHPQLTGPSPTLRVSHHAESWPRDYPLRASVSAMGFGGINTHIVLESVVAERRATFSSHEQSLSRSNQGAELFLFEAETLEQLAVQIEKIGGLAARVSRAEMTDLAAQLQKNLVRAGIRASVVAARPAELAQKLEILGSWLREGVKTRLDCANGIFLDSRNSAKRIVFLFPGQGSPTHVDGGLWRGRFESVSELYARSEIPTGDVVSTRTMQPAIVTASLAGLRVLERFGIEAEAAIGHSLGEITALHWAGAFEEETLMRIVRVRGEAMAELGGPAGAMIALGAPAREVELMLAGEPLAVVGYNSPNQTVVAGAAEAIKNFAQRAAARGWHPTTLAVSHAFHTPFVAAAIPVLDAQLARETFAGLKRSVYSTITGSRLDGGEDLQDLLSQQITSPVRFSSALAALGSPVDLFIEVGPGAVLKTLVSDSAPTPVVSLDAGGNSLQGLLQAVGAAFALGLPVKHAALFADRFARPFNLDWKPKFFTNPCELAPVTRNSAGLEQSTAVENSNPSQIHAPRQLLPELSNTTRVVAKTIDGESALEIVRNLIATRTELPISSIRNDSRMLSDLHLNSISVGQLVAEASRQMCLPHIIGTMEFANASVAEFARALDDLKRTGCAAKHNIGRNAPSGVDAWIRAFTVELVEMKRQAHPGDSGLAAPGHWEVLASKNHALAGPLQEAFSQANGAGIVVCLPESPGEEQIPLLLEAGHAALAMKQPSRFVVVQYGWGGAGFARTLHLENPGIAVCVINVLITDPISVRTIVAEALAASDFTEVHLTSDGRRFEPRLVLFPQSSNAPGAPVDWHGTNNEPGAWKALGPEDVLLVMGGGKGIAAECALAFARETGVKLALIGRSDPRLDKELAANFARIAAAGIRSGYVRADASDEKALCAAVAEIERNLGPVTAILHAAGVNTPQLIGSLDQSAFRRTMLPKISGARNLLAAVDASKLRLFVTFGSIIARTGLSGEAHYATANEWLAALTREFQTLHPYCRCLALEWSVWSGVGMGERLGRIESLMQQGVTPITIDEGVRKFCDLLRQPPPATSLVVTGRFGEPPTLKMAEPELPLWRFLERKRVFYPNIELVVDAELSSETDPYLTDHALHKQLLIPAVIGLEAMAQAAMALNGSPDVPCFENVEFARPIVVPDKAKVTIRIAALQREAGVIEVCLRSEETGFQVDHFRAICRFEESEKMAAPQLELAPFHSNYLSLDPDNDLYGRILFHSGRFCRLRGYFLLKSKECAAEITADDVTVWFGPYLPAQFVLGDPAARDAALHSIQACIPHRRILPTGIDRITIYRQESCTRVVRAKERSRDGNDFIFDVEIVDSQGELIERWDGLHLRAVEIMASRELWPDPLMSPYLERRLEELGENAMPVSIALERGLVEARFESSQIMIQKALGRAARIWRRPDGKPIILGKEDVSASHKNDFTLAIASIGSVACDLEEVSGRTDVDWGDLLGEDKLKLAGLMAHKRLENMDAAATRLWTALECMKKIGQPANSPLVLELNTADGWTILRSGTITITTFVTTIRGSKFPLAFGFARKSPLENQPASATANNFA